MEIHAPKPPHSLKDFLLELLTITIGILIALSLEGVVQWVHHRTLVHEAETNIATEIAENQRELKATLDGLNKTQAQLTNLLDSVRDLRMNRKHAPARPTTVSWTVPELHATSWNTASSTGALAYMSYPEVKRYTRVYDLQQKSEQLQTRGFDAAINAYGATALLSKDPAQISDSQVREMEHATGLALATISGMRDIATALASDYSELESHR